MQAKVRQGVFPIPQRNAPLSCFISYDIHRGYTFLELCRTELLPNLAIAFNC